MSLAVEHMELASKYAYRTAKRLGFIIDAEELEAAAMLGLVEAEATFDPAQGCEFSTHAAWQIRAEFTRYLRTEMPWRYRHNGTLEEDLELEQATVTDRYDPLQDAMKVECIGNEEKSLLLRKAQGATDALLGREYGVGQAAINKRYHGLVRALQEEFEHGAPQRVDVTSNKRLNC